MKNAIIFDAGTIINFSMNSLLDVFDKLKKEFDGEFLVTDAVMNEIVRRPLNIKKYELGAMMIQQLVTKGTFQSPDILSISNRDIEKKTNEILDFCNRIFVSRKRYIHLIDRGEASCLALSDMLTKRNINNVIAIDERTTRMLCENPDNLKRLMETKFHTLIDMPKKEVFKLSRFKIIRSAELLYLAHKKNLLDYGDGQLLDALLYAVKYKGCSITSEEIEEMKRL